MTLERRQGMLLLWLLALAACSGDNEMPSSPSNTAGISGGGGTTTGGASGSGTGGGSGANATGGMSAPSMMAGAGGTGGRTTAGAGGGGAMAGAGGAGSGGASGGTGGTGGMMSTAQTLPPITDYTQEGPFMTTMTSNTGPDSNYTIFRPDPLGKDGFLHSPIIFGPGIITTPSNYTTLLTHLASHGFVTICVNSLGEGPGGAGNLEGMKTGLDWLIAQNAEAGVFQGKLAVNRAITMGYSIGATASVQLSSHDAIITSVVIHGHNTSGDPHGPVLMMTGTDDVIDDMRATLSTLDEAPAVLVALPIGHLDVLGELSASGRYIAPITAWLRYWVNGDQDAKRFFWGADCEMCTSPWIEPEPNAKWSALML